MKWVWIILIVVALIAIGIIIYFVNKNNNSTEVKNDFNVGESIDKPVTAIITPTNKENDCPPALLIPIPNKVWVCRDKKWVSETPTMVAI